MSEFSTNGHRAGGSTSGTYNKNGGLKAVTPPQYAYGNGGYPHANPNGNQVVPSVSSLLMICLQIRLLFQTVLIKVAILANGF